MSLDARTQIGMASAGAAGASQEDLPAGTFRRSAAPSPAPTPQADRRQGGNPFLSLSPAAAYDVEEVLAAAKRFMTPATRTFTVVERGLSRNLIVTRRGIGPITTDAGRFWECLYNVNDEWGEYVVILKADLDCSGNPIFHHRTHLHLRIDSGCQTGQLAGDVTCECRQQLELAQARIEREGEGLVICIPKQDGRGRGLDFKLGTLLLQDYCKLDTVDAAETLAADGKIDTRTYGGAVAILKFLGCDSSFGFALLTNNPKKMSVFAENNLQYDSVPIIVPPTEHTLRHLIAKESRLGHHGLVSATT